MSKEVFTPRETTEVLCFIKDNMVTRTDVVNIIHSEVPPLIDVAVNKAIGAAKLELIDHIDRKTAEVRGDLISVARKIDQKTDVLTDILKHKKYLSPKEASTVKSFSPFPQIN